MASAITRSRNCLRFIACAPKPLRALRRRGGAAPLGEREPNACQCNQERYQADVEYLRPEFEPVGLDPQILADFFQLGAGLHRLGPEVVDLRLLLGREDRAGG